MASEILFGTLIGSTFLLPSIGIYALMRRAGWPMATSAALSVPLAHAAFSVAFQSGFLTGWPGLGVGLGAAVLVWSVATAVRSRSELANDAHRAASFVKSFPQVSLPLLACFLYTLAQALFLPIKSQDALIYHLPRVFLFIQADTFFLDAFSRYHEIIFPVGFDILYYPFIGLGVAYGLPLINLANYLALSACTYGLARTVADRRTAALSALVVSSLTAIALQAASIKNDLAVATVAGACLLLVLRTRHPLGSRRFLLLALLCAFGVSIKTTFIAFLPGLGILAVYRFGLYRFSRIRALSEALLKDWKFAVPALVPILVASQIWLFAWNAIHYETWSGPEDLTYRHTQHDGLLGTTANSIRYGLEILQVDSMTDTLGSAALGLPQFSKLAYLFYTEFCEPWLGNAGASREPFDIAWVTHEDFAWYGPLGAFMFFFCVPYALLRRPPTVLLLLPAIGYFIILAAKMSWMPWNCRFFPTFFVALTPALAVTLASFRSKRFHTVIAVIAITFLFTAKTIDFARPLFPIGRALYSGDLSRPFTTLGEAMRTEANAWSREYRERDLHRGEPSTLLENLPQGARIGLYLKGHDEHFGYFAARPDLQWFPLNIFRGTGKVPREDLSAIFLNSQLDCLLIIRERPEALMPYLAARSEDGYASLILHPRHFNPRKPETTRQELPESRDPVR